MAPSARSRNARRASCRVTPVRSLRSALARSRSSRAIETHASGAYRRAMLRWIVLRRIAAAESAFGESLDYLRFMLRASLGAFLKFAQLVGVATYRRALPAPAFHVVRMTTAKHED